MKKNKNNRVEGTVKIINWCSQMEKREFSFSIEFDKIPVDVSAADYIAYITKAGPDEIVEVEIIECPGKEEFGDLADGKEFQFEFPSGGKKSFFLRVYWCGHRREHKKLNFYWGKGGTIKNKPLEIIEEWKAVLPFIQKIIEKNEEDTKLYLPFAAITYVTQAASYEINKKCGVTLIPSKLSKLFEETSMR